MLSKSLVSHSPEEDVEMDAGREVDGMKEEDTK